MGGQATATTTAAMDAIKKKMQAMKLEKDNAMDKADTLEQQNKEANLRAEKAEDDCRQLQRRCSRSITSWTSHSRHLPLLTLSSMRKIRLWLTLKAKSPPS